MTLTFTKNLHLAVPDFLTEPWHAEFAQSMDSLDEVIFHALIAADVTYWQNSTAYIVGALVISPDTGGIFSCGVAHTSSAAPVTFTQEMALHPTFWTPLGLRLATQLEAEAGTDNTKYMSPLRVAQAIDIRASTGVFVTGDVKLTIRTSPDVGWIILNDGSIGNALSGATTRANADTQSLWVMLYNNVPTLVLQDQNGVTISRTGNPNAQYAANDRLVLPKTLGRALACAGFGSGLTNRLLGVELGVEQYFQAGTQVGQHLHAITQTPHGHPVHWEGPAGNAPPYTQYDPNQNWTASGINGFGGANVVVDGANANITINLSAAPTTPMNNMQPTQFLWVMMKL